VDRLLVLYHPLVHPQQCARVEGRLHAAVDTILLVVPPLACLFLLVLRLRLARVADRLLVTVDILLDRMDNAMLFLVVLRTDSVLLEEALCVTLGTICLEVRVSATLLVLLVDLARMEC